MIAAQSLMYITGHQQQALFQLLPRVCPPSLNISLPHKRQPKHAHHRQVTVQAAGLQDTMMQGLKKALGQVHVLQCATKCRGHLLPPVTATSSRETQHELFISAGLRWHSNGKQGGCSIPGHCTLLV